MKRILILPVLLVLFCAICFAQSDDEIVGLRFGMTKDEVAIVLQSYGLDTKNGELWHGHMKEIECGALCACIYVYYNDSGLSKILVKVGSTKEGFDLLDKYRVLYRDRDCYTFKVDYISNIMWFSVEKN